MTCEAACSVATIPVAVRNAASTARAPDCLHPRKLATPPDRPRRVTPLFESENLIDSFSLLSFP